MFTVGSWPQRVKQSPRPHGPTRRSPTTASANVVRSLSERKSISRSEMATLHQFVHAIAIGVPGGRSAGRARSAVRWPGLVTGAAAARDGVSTGDANGGAGGRSASPIGSPNGNVVGGSPPNGSVVGGGAVSNGCGEGVVSSSKSSKGSVVGGRIGVTGGVTGVVGGTLVAGAPGGAGA